MTRRRLPCCSRSAQLGNARSETLRAFSLDEFERILSKLP